MVMIEIRQTDTFSKWLKSLRDPRAKAKISARLRRLSLGNAGDAEPVGNGISEMRVHQGKGYRVYYVSKGDVLIVLLCGGIKTSQQRDIKLAKSMAKKLEV